MSQILRPISDINTAWSCSTGTARYALIDETTTNDADYITCTTAVTQECKLSAGENPGSGSEHIITVRAKADPLYLTVRLMQGTTLIKSGAMLLKTSYTDYNFTLSMTEVSNITDYTDLRLAFDSSKNFVQYVSQAYLTISDGIRIGLEMGCNF